MERATRNLGFNGYQNLVLVPRCTSINRPSSIDDRHRPDSILTLLLLFDGRGGRFSHYDQVRTDMEQPIERLDADIKELAHSNGHPCRLARGHNTGRLQS